MMLSSLNASSSLAWQRQGLASSSSRCVLDTRRACGRPTADVRCRVLRPNESPEEALQRRLRETEQVLERVTEVVTEEDFANAMVAAGDKLVVLEIESDSVCQTGLEEEVELQWTADLKKTQEPCLAIKHTIQRTARECPDVTFLTLNADEDETEALCDKLGVEVLPTLQFWRNGNKLWEHRGVLHLEQDLGEGVLYFGDTAAGGQHASDHVKELHTKADLEAFVTSQDSKVLTVVDVSLVSATPCIHIFPAVLALARSFTGFAAFARLLGDESWESRALIKDLNIMQVPTFLFFRDGKEVGRHVGSSRGDLIGQILQQQAAAGIAPPPPPPGSVRGTQRKRTAKANRK